MPGLVGFVGREAELSRLLGALGGDARLVLVVGDAGVGKTRFVAEGIARAEAAGMVMVRGECLPLTGTLPLLPMADPLAELGRREGGRLLARALDTAPEYVREEVGRLLPGLDAKGPGGGTAPDGRDGEWSRERLFAGIADLLTAVARQSAFGVGLVVEDVHWADSATLDCLTFVARAGRRGGVRVGVTCRSDEAPLAAHVAGWLAQVRSGAGVDEIRLGPLSRAEAAGQITALAGGPVSPQVVDELYAEAAERVFGYAQAAAHWQRAIELSQAQPDIVAAAGLDLPRLYVRAIDALSRSGDGVQAGMVAAEAYGRFAGHADSATAAMVCDRAAIYRISDAPAAGLLQMEEALRLFEQAPPSADHAEALLDYAIFFVLFVKRRPQATVPALNRALEIAELAGATAMIPQILSVMAWVAFVGGQVQEGFATLKRGQALAQAAQDSPALVGLAINESDARLKLAQFKRAAEVASSGFDAARQAGLGAWESATTLAANTAEALLAVGRTAEAAAVIDPLTTMPPGRDHWLAHVARAEIDLLRGDIGAAASRWQLIRASPAVFSRVDFALESAQRAAEAAVWAGRPGDALAETQRMLAQYQVPDMTILCGRLLTAGMAACADLAEQARARHDEPAVRAAVAAADGLAAWVRQMDDVPFTDHPWVATIPAERATWDAERTRVMGPSDPRAWGAAAEAWQVPGCPHRTGYAWWRQAQALLDTGQPAPAAAALRAAAAAADGHAPLLAQTRMLAERARIPLQPVAPADLKTPGAQPPAEAPGPKIPYGLTDRELAVLRLLAVGRTNAQIGAELYISPKTAGAHVSNILRKLGVSGRVQAAALAERAGLLPSPLR
jgi:DNA-binding CsgD family transcriptional regulator